MIEMGQRPPERWRIYILCLLFFVGVAFLYMGFKKSGNDEYYMLKSQLNSHVESISKGILKIAAPGLFISCEEEIPYSTKLTGAVYDFASPLKTYIKEYGAGKELVVETQAVPESYLENGGQDEESGYEQITEPVEIEKSSTEEQNIESADNYDKSNGNNHTYSKKFSDKQLSKYSFVKKTFYSIDSITPVTSKDLNAKKLLSKDLHIEKQGEAPKILIYHTHASEAFKDSKKGKISDTVVGVGDVLAKELTEKYNIPVVHDRSIYDVVDGKLDRSLAYNVAGDELEKTLAKYPTIEVVIDLHRDGVAENTRLVTEIDKKPTAQIMFFNGMSRIKGKGDISYLKNPCLKGNLAFSLQLQVKSMDYYDNYTRKIFLRSYRYNLHYKERSVLIEAGAQTNTVEEVKNAMYPLARILNDVLCGKN